MTIWGDADSLPIPVRDIMCRRVLSELSRSQKLKAVFVANRPIPLPKQAGVSLVRVKKGEGVADAYIADHAQSGDLIVTRDIPLAERLLLAGPEGLRVINDRGDVFLRETVRERRSLRDAMRELAINGLVNPGNNNYGQRESRAFSQAFDRELTTLLKNTSMNAGEGRDEKNIQA